MQALALRELEAALTEFKAFKKPEEDSLAYFMAPSYSFGLFALKVKWSYGC